MEITTIIVLGVVSGTLTTAFLYVLSRFFTEVLLPWYQRVKYQGVDLHGTWTGKVIDSDEIVFPFRLILDQNAHQLTGTATLDKSTAMDGDSSTTYSLSGNVWEGYITLNYKSLDRTRLSFATSLLRVVRGGRKLEGYFVFRDMKHDEIRERVAYFDRVD